jgi:hypothetical protein
MAHAALPRFAAVICLAAAIVAAPAASTVTFPLSAQGTVASLSYKIEGDATHSHCRSSSFDTRRSQRPT